MDSKITLNIVEPGSGPTPDPVVPNTGLFTSGIGGPEATAIGTVLILTIAAIVVAVCYRKQKKAGKVTKLAHLVDSTKAVLKSKKRITAGLSAIALLASAGTLTTLLASANKNNTNAVEEDNLTLDVTGGDITIEVGDEPVFAVAEVKATVKEATEAGYTLTAFTDSTDLVSTTDSSKVIPMVAADEGELVALANNTYGLALEEKPTTKDESVYAALSTDLSNPTILKAIDDYSSTPANDTTTIYYGFYITPDVPYGTYTGTNINYTVEPHYITNLSFNGNGNDGGVDMEGMTIIAGDTITLPENTYTKEGYNFIGWNTVAEPTEQDPGEAYEDQADYTAPATSQNLTLYAQWEEATLYMQDVANWGSKLEIGDETIAVDNRDNKEYYVARLADGNIWMTQNLDFDIVNGGADLNSTNTDVPESWADGGNLTNTYATDDTTWSNSSTIPESYDPGNLYWNGAMTPPTDQETCEEYGGTWQPWGSGVCTGANLTSPTGNSHYHLGNYYNWTAAMAMSDSSSYKTDSTDVDQSICPAGWRLPANTGNKSFDNLVTAVPLTAGVDGNIHANPNYFTYSSRWDGSLSNVGSGGNYWSSVVNSANNSYYLEFSISGHLDSQQYRQYRSEGYSVRCVAR